ncbi:MAG: prepilin-type N-terminal cleavage/methylation domain-containing protein [Sumerlaeia bacterium]
MSLRTPSKAFTLIELLIVVAIIAILAAIAVPNFLEAQVRAKVSRAKADMRSLATGLESYRVDNNKYVPTPNYNRVTGAQTFTHEARWAYLTTPIAYMTSIIDDPFGDTDVTESNWNTSSKFRTFDYTAFDTEGSFEANFFKPDLVQAYGYSESILWLIASQGPDLEPGLKVNDPAAGTVSGFATGLPYDPTNGTVSAGDVIRFGPGGGTAGGA